MRLIYIHILFDQMGHSEMCLYTEHLKLKYFTDDHYAKACKRISNNCLSVVSSMPIRWVSMNSRSKLMTGSPTHFLAMLKVDGNHKIRSTQRTDQPQRAF